MRKLLAFLAVAVAALALSAPAKAQYTGSTAYNPCNTQFASGFSNYRGGGENGEFVVRFYVNVHYQAANLETVKADLAKAMVAEMNYRAQNSGSNVRFVATDFDNSSPNLNFTIWLDIYDNNGDTENGYQLYTSVGGWGVGHLFKFYTGVGSTENVLVQSADGLADRFANGWTCGTQK